MPPALANLARQTGCPRTPARRPAILGLRSGDQPAAGHPAMGSSLSCERKRHSRAQFARAGGAAWGPKVRARRSARVGTRRVLRVGMTPVFFGLKRAYYATLGLTRRTLRRMGLTAARMDLLYVIHKNKRYPTQQSSLWRTLGVCPSVVIRMLKRLEAMGYVKRDVPTYDTRRRKVTLTTKGRARILRAIRQFIGWGYAQLALDSALEPRRWHSEWHTHVATSQLEEYLRLIRLAFGDSSDVVYTSGLRDDQLPRATSLVLRWVS
jgi:DNA-binding MarR family transcriptional regulator